MAIIGFIVLGDRTSHGGVVMSGDPTWTIDGQPVARVGDKVSCPRCKRVATIVTSRFSTVIDLGKPAAFDQDTTDCGAVIYSRHNGHSGWGSTDVDNATTSADALADDPAPKQAQRFQEHFILQSSETGEPLAGVPYTVKTGDGMTLTGKTDEQGRTEIVWTDSPLPVEVIAHPEPDNDADPYHYAEQNYEGL